MKQPALIVFCREPVAGKTKTRLLSHLSPRDAAALAGAFIDDTLAKASQVCPTRLIIAGTAESPVLRSSYFRRQARRFGADLVDQGSGSLGARMARTLEPFTSDSGALLIGTDVPSLPITALRQLYLRIRQRRVVLGPSLDGGYYAVGVRGALPPIFSGIRWSSAGVFDETIAHLKRAGRSAAVGPVWHDVDRWPDVLLLCSYLSILKNEAGNPHPCPATASVLRRLGLLRPRR